MKTRIINKSEAVDVKFRQTMKELNKAEFAAWGLFIGVGILYVVLSLVVAV